MHLCLHLHSSHLISSLDVGPSVQQERDNLQMALPSCLVKGRGPKEWIRKGLKYSKIKSIAYRGLLHGIGKNKKTRQHNIRPHNALHISYVVFIMNGRKFAIESNVTQLQMFVTFFSPYLQPRC
jgi:hypothetical protein